MSRKDTHREVSVGPGRSFRADHSQKEREAKDARRQREHSEHSLHHTEVSEAGSGMVTEMSTHGDPIYDMTVEATFFEIPGRDRLGSLGRQLMSEMDDLIQKSKGMAAPERKEQMRALKQKQQLRQKSAAEIHTELSACLQHHGLQDAIRGVITDVITARPSSKDALNYMAQSLRAIAAS